VYEGQQEPYFDLQLGRVDAVLLDQAPVGLVGHGDLRDPRHRERIDEAGEDGEKNEENERGTQVLKHGRS